MTTMYNYDYDNDNNSIILRLVINSGRSVIVWAISLAVGWQHFQPLQIVGFLIMSLGVFIFNDILLGKSAREYHNM